LAKNGAQWCSSWGLEKRNITKRISFTIKQYLSSLQMKQFTTTYSCGMRQIFLLT
jgi:hypothetical protein